MSHLHGLPPLPKSLSGFSFIDSHNARPNPPMSVRSTSIRGGQYNASRQSSPGFGRDDSTSKKLSNLDTQLSVLRREMYSLRQQDLALLSQLWSLNESIQDFRQIMQNTRVLSPPSPSPTASSADEEEFYMSSTSMGMPSRAGGTINIRSGSEL